MSRPLWAWANWSKIMPPLTAVISGIKAEAVIRPRQAGDHDNWLSFGRLPWNEKNNRTWTTKYLTDPNLAGKVSFVATEIWAPSRAISFERRRGPELFCLLDRNEPANTQGFVLAIRKDLLSRVDIAADETIFSVREFFERVRLRRVRPKLGRVRAVWRNGHHQRPGLDGVHGRAALGEGTQEASRPELPLATVDGMSAVLRLSEERGSG